MVRGTPLRLYLLTLIVAVTAGCAATLESETLTAQADVGGASTLPMLVAVAALVLVGGVFAVRRRSRGPDRPERSHGWSVTADDPAARGAAFALAPAVRPAAGGAPSMVPEEPVVQEPALQEPVLEEPSSPEEGPAPVPPPPADAAWWLEDDEDLGPAWDDDDGDPARDDELDAVPGDGDLARALDHDVPTPAWDDDRDPWDGDSSWEAEEPWDTEETSWDIDETDADDAGDAGDVSDAGDAGESAGDGVQDPPFYRRR
jgi:hypothetical protein